ncbi:MAG TPA: fused MFS/spermidine synthase [Candidatus Sulfotelmatobacter sp.]|nr:fused MFS/spermidine synthase [Candidatus Sulfotelmatobacter sp.]
MTAAKTVDLEKNSTMSVGTRGAHRTTVIPKTTLALVGITALVSQIVLMRELIVVFRGNEFSLGIMLATWLLWTAAGSGLAGRLALGRSNARRTIAQFECLVAVSLPATIWIVRASKPFFQTVPGELVGPVPMLLTSLTSLSLLCVLSGCLFVIAARMYQQECGVTGRVATSAAYLFDAAGSGLGGILASVVLLRVLDAFQIAICIALLNLCAAAILLVRVNRRQVAMLSAAAVALGLLLFGFVAPSLKRSAQRRLWQGFRVLESRDSIYGNLVVTQTGSIRSIYENGAILASAPDENAAEEAVHFALLEHPAPKRILLIGGGVNGSIVEALKHKTVQQLDYVELDPVLIQIFKEFFQTQAVSLSDPRVQVHYADGRHFLKTTSNIYDVIILNIPEPQTAQLNRFYTAEFFHSARDHLSLTGLLALQLPSSEDYISPDRGEFLRCIDHTLQEVFPYIAAIPGNPIHFFAASRADVLTDDPQILISRLQTRNLPTQYVREYFIPFRMMPDRLAQIRDLLKPLSTTPVNRDFSPIAYYFDVVLWNAQFKTGYTRLFRAAAQVGFASILTGVLVVLLSVVVLLACLPSHEKRVRASAVSCMAATGFTLMALQVFLLLAFQAIYGYVYHQLAILIGAFMAGIAFGSSLGISRLRWRDHASFTSVVAATQFMLALSVPAALYLVTLLSRTSSTGGTMLAAQVVFPLLAAAYAVLGGYQFPIATELFLRDSHTDRGLGVLYAVDLLGGCAGALLLSAYLIPVFGFWKTAWLSAAVNLAPALLAARVRLEEKASQA